MNKDDFKDYFGKQVSILVNTKNINGIINEINDKYIKLDTDFGIAEISIDKIQDIQKIDIVKDLFVYVCKNQLCKCKGIRFLSNKSKLNWPCKHFKQFSCPIKKICNFNELPLNLRYTFLNGMHSEIPVIEK